MAPPYTLTKLTEVKDSAPGFGLGEIQEARFANADLEAQDTGLSLHRIKPAQRQAFGHRHGQAEEVYVVLAGSGRIKLDDDVLEIEPLDAVRVAPGVTRAFEASADGVDVLAVGPRHEGDGEMVKNWWVD
ncbi:MAG: cupin domain-containing protein [Solirubrobacterales bacterium]|nr:cupin domain-containing protein [Solirubrobacterales bacterium]